MGDEIDRMVSEAEKFKAEDEAMQSRIMAKNGFENYVYSIKSSVADEKLAGKLDDADTKTIETWCRRTSHGLSRTRTPRRMSTRPRRRRWRARSCPSWPSSTRALVAQGACQAECPVGCREACLVGCQVGCQVVCQVVCQALVAPPPRRPRRRLGPPLR